MEMNLDNAVALSVKARDKIRELEAEIDKIKEMRTKIEEYILAELTRQGLQNVKTLHGTAFISVKESVTIADWDQTLPWIQENGAYEFLQKAVNKTAVLELMGQDRSVPPPPGVNYVAVRTVGIRKS